MDQHSSTIGRFGSAGSVPIYRSTKTYGHNEGLSCCFRQWRADHSHCRYLHGYALAFRFVFATKTLDGNNWCLDFGGLQPLKLWLKSMFDHTLLVAEDDPELKLFRTLESKKLVQIRVLPSVGCEAISEYVFHHATAFVHEKTQNRVWVESVEVKEHEGNSAVFSRELSSRSRDVA